MKHLLTGVAMAAVLAIAAPVWAQGPSPSPSAPAAEPAAPAAPAAEAPAHKAAGRKSMSARRHLHHVVHHRAASQGDQTTEQLNQQAPDGRFVVHD